MEVMTTGWKYEKKWTGEFSIPIASIFIEVYYLQYTNFLSLSDKESVIVIPVVTTNILRKKGEITAVSVLTRLSISQVLWRSLN